jgi:DNA-binding transcriptional regulator YdaS (Cro superfamily)
MKKLIDYVNSLTPSEREALSRLANTSISYMRKAASKGQIFEAARCRLVVGASNGALTLADLRPDDWHLIWPELVEQPAVGG